MESKNGRKTKLIVLALIVVAAVAAYIWWQGQQPAPAASESLSGMQSAATSVDTGNLDQEFDSINKDLNAL